VPLPAPGAPRNISFIAFIPFLINQGIPCSDGASSGFQAV